MPKRLTLQECIDKATSKGGYCHAIEYINNQTKMPWECEKGHKWETTFDHVKSGSWCARCEAIKHNKDRKLTIEAVLNFVESKGWKCYTKEYIDNDQMLDLECNKGHCWQAPFRRIKNQDTGCPYCEKKHQFTLEEIAKMALDSGNKIICLTTSQIKSRDPAEWKCLEKEHIWTLPLFRIINGGFCCSICVKQAKIKNIWQDVLDGLKGTYLTLLNHPDPNSKIYNTKNIGGQWKFQCFCGKIIYPYLHNVIRGVSHDLL